MREGPEIFRNLLSLGIDYLRWTQLAPLILMWAMVLGLLLALAFVGHQEAAWSLADRLARWLASLPWVGSRFTAWLEAQAQDGTVSAHIGMEDLESVVLKAWAALSLGFMVLGWLTGWLLGPFRPWSLKRKMLLALLACLAVFALIMALYFSDRGNWNDPVGKVLFSVGGMSLVLLLATTWFLSLSHALGNLSGLVAGTGVVPLAGRKKGS